MSNEIQRQEAEAFAQELVRFLQPAPNVGVALVLRRPDGAFCEMMFTVDSMEMLLSPGATDTVIHEALTKLTRGFRQGPTGLGMFSGG